MVNKVCVPEEHTQNEEHSHSPASEKLGRAVEDTEAALCILSATERGHFKGNFQKVASLFTVVDSEPFLLQHFGKIRIVHAQQTWLKSSSHGAMLS